MKKYFSLSSILLYILCIPAFFIIGATLAGISGAGKGQGLAGGAIVFGYGLISSIAGFALAIFAVYRAESKIIRRINWILLILLLLMLGVAYYRYQSLNSETTEPNLNRTPTQPAPNKLYLSFITHTQETQPILGLGFFTPNFSENKVLYFYGNINFEKPIQDHPTSDSLLFEQKQHGGFDIVYAPPWLMPAHLKLDYDILYFRIVSLSRDFAEVIVNEQTQQKAYVNRFAGTIIPLPDFLLHVFSVDFIKGQQQSIRYKPLSHAAEINVVYEHMRPIEIKEDWMRVQLMDKNVKVVGTGWIQWRTGNKLLITYSLLS